MRGWCDIIKVGSAGSEFFIYLVPRFHLPHYLVPRFHLPHYLVPRFTSFPGSTWERIAEGSAFSIGTALEAEPLELRSQVEPGNEKYEKKVVTYPAIASLRSQ